MKIFLSICLFIWTLVPLKAQDILSLENQIIEATQVVPENERANATVIGYDGQGEQVVLRKGSGNFVCLSNNIKSKSFSVACYHKDLEPLMARGRMLRKEGKNSKEIEAIRAAEAKKGLLKLPTHPSTLYVLYGKNAYYDDVAKKVVNGKIRYVIYVPWATAKSTGLPLAPQVPDGPWLMFSGSYKAHIMMTPLYK